jgi:cellulose synthase operon protein C
MAIHGDDPVLNHVSTLRPLVSASLFLKAYQYITEHIGAIADWRTWADPELGLLAARTLIHLGYRRQGEALIYRLWRRHRGSDVLASDYINTLHGRRGPLTALDTLNTLRDQYSFTPSCEADLAAEEVQIYSAFRDFSAAENILKKIPADHQSRWSRIQAVYLLQAQDQNEAALVAVEKFLEEFPDYRSGMRAYADILQILDRADEAIDVLKKYWNESEALWIGYQLFCLLLNEQRFVEAEECLERIIALIPYASKETDSLVRMARADLLCAQQKYVEALPFLEQRSFFHNSVKESIDATSDQRLRRILDVPFIRQAHMTCAPASIAAVTAYWGRPEQQSVIVDAICYGGTQSYDERKWLENSNWHCVEFELAFSTIKPLIDRGVPVLFATVFAGSAHLQIIIGYDENMGVYLLRDPYNPRLQEFLIDECASYFASSGPRCLAFVPNDQTHLFENIDFPQQDSYDYLYAINKALEANQRDLAQESVRLLQQKYPDQRLTAVGQRTLAIYDRDEPEILAATEKLLTLYPDDVNFQLSKVYSLLDIGASAEALAMLEDLMAQPNCHYLIKCRLANRLRFDHRELARTEHLYKHLLKYGQTHDETLYGYAGVLWDKGDYQRSYQLYRFCTCLVNTNETYADSYFRAARFFKETEIALEFLRDRFARYGEKSGGPATSLFHAYDYLERTDEALAVLAEGLSKRPNDGDLLLFAARRYCYLAKTEKAFECVNRAKPLVSAIAFNEVSSEIHERHFNFAEALKAGEAILEIDPLNSKAHATITRLLVREGKREQALTHINHYLSQYPGNRHLQKLLIQRIHSNDHAALRDAYQRYLHHHPSDSWAWRNLAQTQAALGDFSAALTSAQAALDIEGTDCVNWATLGDAQLASGLRSQAHASYRTAITRSCDYGYAFDRLMDCSLDSDSQLADVEFIHAELMRQVSYGDGILDFPRVAARVFEPEKIGDFLQTAHTVRPDLWQSWLALGLHKIQQDQLDQALELFNQALARFPLLPRLYLERAQLHRLLAHYDDAIVDLKTTLELSPSWIRASNVLCEIYTQLGQLDDALIVQHNALRHSPTEASPHGFIADLYLMQDRQQDAVDALQKAIEFDPEYTWGWNKLFSITSNADAQAKLLGQLKAAMLAWPENTVLLDLFVTHAPTPEDAVVYLEEFLQRHPHDVDVVIRTIQTYAKMHQHEKALSFTAESYWDNKVPLAIKAAKARILAETGYLSRAIELIDSVAKENPNFYEAWRLLVIWQTRMGNAKAVEEAVDHCVAIYPHDANVLCFCAEYLQRIDAGNVRIMKYLQQAFELDPSDQYNALTLIDFALEQKEYARADTALERLQKYHRSIYIDFRALQLALARGHHEPALNLFQTALTDRTRADNGLLRSMWRELATAKLSNAAQRMIEDYKSNRAAIDANAGYCLCLYDLNKGGSSRAESALLKMTFDQAFEQNYLEAYLNHIGEYNQVLSWRVSRKISAGARKTALNSGLLAYFLLQSNQYRKTAKLLQGIETMPDVEAWVLYNYSLCCRELNRWNDGEKLVQQAYHLAADNSRQHILVWMSYDQVRSQSQKQYQSHSQNQAQSTIDTGMLDHVSEKKIDPISRYALAILKLMAKLGDQPFVDVYKEVSADLKIVGQTYRQIRTGKTRDILKRNLYQELMKKQGDAGFIKRTWARSLITFYHVTG